MLVLQIGRLVADEVVLQRHLVVALRVHEMVALAVVVDELVLAVLDEGALDLVGGAKPLRHLHPVADAAHVHLGHRRAFAGVDVLGGER